MYILKILMELYFRGYPGCSYILRPGQDTGCDSPQCPPHRTWETGLEEMSLKKPLASLMVCSQIFWLYCHPLPSFALATRQLSHDNSKTPLQVYSALLPQLVLSAPVSGLPSLGAWYLIFVFTFCLQLFLLSNTYAF